MSCVSWLPPNGCSRDVDRLVVAQHRDVHDARADVHHGDVLVPPLVGQLLADQLEGGLHRVGLDVHHQRLQPRRLGDGDAVLDLLLARGGDQDLDLFRSRGRRPEHLEVEVHLVQRKRDVLVGLAFHLELEVVLAQAGRADDLLGDHRRGGQRERDVLGPSRELLPRRAAPLRRPTRGWRYCRRAPSPSGAARWRSARRDSAPFPASASSTILTAEELMSIPKSGGALGLKISSCNLIPFGRKFPLSFGYLGALLILCFKS